MIDFTPAIEDYKRIKESVHLLKLGFWGEREFFLLTMSSLFLQAHFCGRRGVNIYY